MYSMTGYGGADRMYDPYRINIDIKSLNSKFADVRLKFPSELAEMEIEVRQIALKSAIRGKVEIQMSLEGENLESNLCEIDQEIFSRYYKQLDSLSKELGLDQQNILSALVNLPGVVRIKEFTIEEDMKQAIIETLHEALEVLMIHRRTEGAALAKALDQSVENIMEGHSKIKTLEEERMVTVRERLQHNLAQEIEPDKIDSGRFEQELIYYLDKLDIHEEMVRLKQHCVYFLEEMKNEEVVKGRKLNFISQEMGREINTLGSKASHAGIQRVVVEMKNELDKIKEQLANVL